MWNVSALTWEFRTTSWSKTQVEAAVDTAREFMRMIDAQVFPPIVGSNTFGKYRRGWWCGPTWCGAWNICPYKASVSDDVEPTSVRTPGWKDEE